MLVQSSKCKFEFTGPNKILEFIFIYLHVVLLIKTKTLLVFGQRTGAHHEDCLSNLGKLDNIEFINMLFINNIYNIKIHMIGLQIFV